MHFIPFYCIAFLTIYHPILLHADRNAVRKRSGQSQSQVVATQELSAHHILCPHFPWRCHKNDEDSGAVMTEAPASQERVSKMAESRIIISVHSGCTLQVHIPGVRRTDIVFKRNSNCHIIILCYIHGCCSA